MCSVDMQCSYDDLLLDPDLVYSFQTVPLTPSHSWDSAGLIASENESKDLGRCPSRKFEPLRISCVKCSEKHALLFFISKHSVSFQYCIFFNFCPEKNRLLTSWIFAFPEDSPITWMTCMGCAHALMALILYGTEYPFVLHRMQEFTPHTVSSRMSIISTIFL